MGTYKCLATAGSDKPALKCFITPAHLKWTMAGVTYIAVNDGSIGLNFRGSISGSDRISSLSIVNLECKSRAAGGIKRGSGEPEGFIPIVFAQETAELIGAAVFQNTKIIRRHNDQESFVIGMHGTLFYVSAAYFSAEYIRYLTGPQGAESSFDGYLWVRQSVHYDLKDERDRVQAAKALWALVAYIASGEARVNIITAALEAKA